MAATRKLLIPLLFIASCGDSHEGGLSQVDATPSLPGLCATGPSTCSDEGRTECVDGGLRTCNEVAGCLQWGVVVACAPGSICVAPDDVARCVGSCDDEACTVPEARRCAPGDARAFQRCTDDDHDGCLGWSAAADCPSGETCGQGGFCADACADECAAGAKRCEGNGVVTCGQHDGDACVEWGEPEPCDHACALGACVDTCRDECAADGIRRCDGAAVDVCQGGADGCRHWVAAESCAPGTTCSAGACAAECVDECAAGPSTCDAGGVVTCGQYDADACLDVSLPAACDAGQACSEGACSAVAQCQDECAADGDRRCDASGVGVEECGQHDADACREWARVADCDAGESCSLGRCVTGCADECTAGEHRCQPGSSTLVEVCKADADLDTCLEWAVASDCADQSEVCSGGACAAECADECPGFATCDGDAILPCGDFDDDPCLDLGAPAPCDPSEVCVAGDAAAACQPAPAPGHLKISEVLYNNPGDDTGTFIELAGEPGLPLAGFTLVAINGGTGLSYATLALGGSMPADGFYVIAHPQAGDAIAAAADVKDTFADLQNGPDNLQIVWGDTVVDALGYGNFGNDDEFRGEGEPAVDVPAGHALARIGDLQDTDDNRADFADVEVATPGTGYLAARTPSAFRDLAVTEVMADPKVLDDTQGEWFELYNPHADVTWDLAGCRIESSATESYLIDASLVVPPGGRVVLARSANPGFVPDRVYSSIKLANASDVLSLVCGGVHIDDFAWTVAAPTGKSISVDPSYEDADLNDDPDAWCPAPVTAAEGKDAATPGLANPPCPNVSGVYTRTALDSQWGSCDEAPDWQAFSFDAAPAASGDATLTFQWWSVFCPLYADSSDIWIEIADGDGGYTEIAHTTLNTVLQACSWRDGSSSVSAAVVSAARATSGRIEGRFRIEGGCPQGVGCGILGQTVPYNCARRLTLSYPY